MVKSESPIPDSHFPMRFAAAIYTAQDPSLTGIEWVPAPPSPPPTPSPPPPAPSPPPTPSPPPPQPSPPPAPSPPPSSPVSFSGGAASLDSTISSASSGTLSKTSGGNAWGDYAFSDYELTKDGCVVMPPTAHAAPLPSIRTLRAMRLPKRGILITLVPSDCCALLTCGGMTCLRQGDQRCAVSVCHWWSQDGWPVPYRCIG